MYTFFLQAPAQQPWWQMPLLIVGMFAIVWFFMLRPQQKRQKEIERRRNELQKGSLVVTAGGIHGKIKEVNETDFLVEIAEGVRIRIEKTSVFAVQEKEEKK